MTLDLKSSECFQILDTAVMAFQGGATRPQAQTVAQALLQAEKIAKQQRILYPFTALLGQWRLWLIVTPQKSRHSLNAWYVPKLVQAEIHFKSDSSNTHGEIQNQLTVGLLQVCLTGLAKYPGQKNLLAFDFTKMQFGAFGKRLYQGSIRGGEQKAAEFTHQPIKNLPFFAFFWVTETAIAARGRGGGLALWVKAD